MIRKIIPAKYFTHTAIYHPPSSIEGSAFSFSAYANASLIQAVCYTDSTAIANSSGS